jgi:hypothetical protein
VQDRRSLGWYGIDSTSEERGFAAFEEMREGLEGIGIEARVERRGLPNRRIAMLLVRRPSDRIEVAERRLLERVGPIDDDGVEWAGAFVVSLRKRWPEVVIWSGDDGGLARAKAIFGESRVTRPFAGWSYSVDIGGKCSISACQRSAADLASKLLDRTFPDESEAARWVALRSAEVDRSERLHKWRDALRAKGVPTRVFAGSAASGVRSVLAVDSEAEDVEVVYDKLLRSGLDGAHRLCALPEIVVDSVSKRTYERLVAMDSTSSIFARDTAFWPADVEWIWLTAPVDRVDEYLARLDAALEVES